MQCLVKPGRLMMPPQWNQSADINLMQSSRQSLPALTWRQSCLYQLIMPLTLSVYMIRYTDYNNPGITCQLTAEQVCRVHMQCVRITTFWLEVKFPLTDCSRRPRTSSPKMTTIRMAESVITIRTWVIVWLRSCEFVWVLRKNTCPPFVPNRD